MLIGNLKRCESARNRHNRAIKEISLWR